MSSFKFNVKTDNPGTTSSVQFLLPLRSGQTYNFDIDWGDTTTQTVVLATSITHTYPIAGTYEISITENAVGGFPTIYFNNGDDRRKLIELTQWGTNKWVTLNSSFYGCSNLIISATDFATAVTSLVTDFASSFRGCSGLTDFPLIDTSGGITLSYTWYGCSGLTSFPLLDSASVVNFDHTWYNCSGLTSFPLLDTSSGGFFGSTWEGCTGLTSFPLIDTSSGYNFGYTWRYCSGLTSFPLIDVSNTNQLPGTWYNCSGLTSFPLIDTVSITDFTNTWYGCSSLTSFPLIDTSGVTDFTSTWSGCSNLTSFPLIDTSNGLQFYETWRNCLGLSIFPTLNFASMTFGMYAFYGTTLATTSYTSILESLATVNINTGVVFDGGNSKYYVQAVDDRDLLINVRNWTITDGGLAPTYIDGEVVLIVSDSVVIGVGNIEIQSDISNSILVVQDNWDVIMNSNTLVYTPIKLLEP